MKERDKKNTDRAIEKPAQDRAVRRAHRHSERTRERYEDRVMANNPPFHDDE